MSEGLEVRRAAALNGYCTARIQQIDLEKARVNGQDMKELQFGLLLLALALLASASVELIGWLPEFLQVSFSDGLVIVGWIALWHPVDLRCFER